MADQPIFDKYRAADKFERHPPKTNKKTYPMQINESNNKDGVSTLNTQIAIANEQPNGSEDGL